MILKLLLFTFLVVPLSAKDIYIKYRGDVDIDNGHFKHLNVGHSSLIKDMYYDKKNNYLLVKLGSTYYHYCGLSDVVAKEWISSSSLGDYYLSNIKGNYDCRVYPMPKY